MNPTIYLSETAILNYSNSIIQNFIQENSYPNQSLREKSVQLFYAVRDQFLYNPYYINISLDECKASKVIERGYGHCIDKASLLIAVYRAVGIPARIGLAKVQNHIATERLEEYLGSNVLTPHGYVELYLQDKWWKVTPAFNKSLCDKIGVATLDFDGANDCLFQEFDKTGKQFMSYLEDYGTFSDIPLAFIIQNMQEHYPKLKSKSSEGVLLDLREIEN